MTPHLAILIALLFLAAMACILPWIIAILKRDADPLEPKRPTKRPGIKEDVKLHNGRVLHILSL